MAYGDASAAANSAANPAQVSTQNSLSNTDPWPVGPGQLRRVGYRVGFRRLLGQRRPLGSETAGRARHSPGTSPGKVFRDPRWKPLALLNAGGFLAHGRPGRLPVNGDTRSPGVDKR